MKFILGGIVLLYLFALGVRYYNRWRILPPSEMLDVDFVADGDTLHLKSPSNGRIYKVRLIGIDAPESHPSDKLTRDAQEQGVSVEKIMAAGRTAERRCRQIVSGRKVSLQFDPSNASRMHQGLYGRLLAYVWVHAEEGPFMLNRVAIREGWAHATEYPHARLNEFLTLRKQSRAERARKRQEQQEQRLQRKVRRRRERAETTSQRIRRRRRR